MYYTRLVVQCSADFTEILMAEIAETGFETFLETETGFEAYTEAQNFDAAALQEIKARYDQHSPMSFLLDRVEKKNWNEEWEKSYEPILVENTCLIRAHFHKPEKQYPFEIVITPKMSFGTGHHQTTYLMIKNQLQIDHRGKRVMDAGCGTAILSVMASKLGAKEVEAFDIDEWSVINGQENIEVNQCANINIRQGKISDVRLSGSFDIILANINKNVLLEEIKTYSTFLNPQGLLLLSGFYTKDIDDLIMEAGTYALQEVRRDERESWAALLMGKK